MADFILLRRIDTIINLDNGQRWIRTQGPHGMRVTLDAPVSSEMYSLDGSDAMHVWDRLCALCPDAVAAAAKTRTHSALVEAGLLPAPSRAITPADFSALLDATDPFLDDRTGEEHE